ncbi:MAG: phosphatidylglycerol lysyltransferase domain-containing protein [Candidatus Woesearchaeota archaeon]
MEVLSDIKGNKDLLERSFIKYGNCAEHYYYCFLYNIEPWEDPKIFLFENDSTILAKYDKDDNDWYVFVGLLAPSDKAIGYFKKFLEYAFNNGCRKVWVEFRTDFRKIVLKEFKNSEYKLNPISYTLTWPVFDMKEWTGEKMEGKDWKDMRYYWNKFFREHKVEFRSYIQSDKDTLKELVLRWKKERNGTDKTYDHYYLSVIDNDFIGYETRVMVVDDKICGVTAGYFIKDKDYYYSSIGIIVKEHDRIGEIANMDDLIECKKKGYGIVDFGGGEPHLTEFKKKFRPTYYYKTHVFSIQRKNDKDKTDKTY